MDAVSGPVVDLEKPISLSASSEILKLQRRSWGLAVTRVLVTVDVFEDEPKSGWRCGKADFRVGSPAAMAAGNITTSRSSSKDDEAVDVDEYKVTASAFAFNAANGELPVLTDRCGNGR